MSTEPIADERSCTLRIDADATWADAEAAARWGGMTLAYLVDTLPERTIATTLRRPAWLPPLWPPHTARAACISLSARTIDGREYGSVVAPRTASGPDLRAFFLEAGDRFGTIGAVTLRCERIAPLAWLRGDDLDALQPIVNRLGSIVTVHGDDEGPAVRVRRGLGISDAALRELATAGWNEGSAPSRRDAGRALAVVPWDVAARAFATETDGGRAVVIAAGPTHLCVTLSGGVEIERQIPWARATVDAAGRPSRVVLDADIPTDAADDAIELGEVVA